MTKKKEDVKIEENHWHIFDDTSGCGFLKSAAKFVLWLIVITSVMGILTIFASQGSDPVEYNTKMDCSFGELDVSQLTNSTWKNVSCEIEISGTMPKATFNRLMLVLPN